MENIGIPAHICQASFHSRVFCFNNMRLIRTIYSAHFVVVVIHGVYFAREFSRKFIAGLPVCDNDNDLYVYVLNMYCVC